MKKNHWLAILFVVTIASLLIAGCGQKSSNVVKVGVPVASSGVQAVKGANLEAGIDLAIAEINAAGGILGKQIEPIYVDTEGTADAGVIAYERLCTVSKVDVIVGGLSNEVALPTMDIVSKYGVPTIYSIPSSPDLGKKVMSNPELYKGVFFTDPPTNQIHAGMLTWLQKQADNGTLAPNKTIAIIIEDTDWAQMTRAAYKEALEKSGWNIVLDVVVPVGEVDFTTILNQVAQLKPDVIKLEFTGVTTGVAITKQMNELGTRGFIIAGYYMKDIEFSKLAPDLAEEQVNLLEVIPATFTADLLAKDPNATPVTASWGYDSMYIMKEAIERAGSLDKDAISKALAETDFTGATMRTVYDPNTHQAISRDGYKYYGVGQYLNNKLVSIWPEDGAESKFIVPSYINWP